MFIILGKLLTNLLDRLDRIDEEGKGTIIEDKINKLSHQKFSTFIPLRAHART